MLTKLLFCLFLISKVSDAPVSDTPYVTNACNSNSSVKTMDVSNQREKALKEELEHQKINRISVSNRNGKKQPIKTQKPKIQTLKEIIKNTEKQYQIPENLLLSIAKIETNMKPYAINYAGQGHFFKNIHSAVTFARELIKDGETNFSVGCCQLHYPSHSKNFKSLYDMFDPEKNVRYAATLLKKLYKKKYYSWENAVKSYHSGHEISNCIYYKKIVSRMGRSV